MRTQREPSLVKARVAKCASTLLISVKNVRGGPDDEDPRPPPRLPSKAKGKATKKLAMKKRKYPNADIVRAAVVAAAIEHAEAEGARSGV